MPCRLLLLFPDAYVGRLLFVDNASVPTPPQGASTTFQPLSGLLRGNCPPAASNALLAAAHLHDKATVALYCRPTARLLFSAYILLLHILVLL